MLYAESFLKAYTEKRGIELTSDIIEGLDNYDPRELYRLDENGPKLVSITHHRIEVGKISNLIRRMRDRGATTSEMVRALRHLLTIVDAAKHHLDYKKSEIDNDITNLIIKYSRKRDTDGRYSNKYLHDGIVVLQLTGSIEQDNEA